MKLSEIFRKAIARKSPAPASETVAPPPEVAEAQAELTNASGGDQWLDVETVNRVGKRKIELTVSDSVAVRPPLPAGYAYLDTEASARLHAELLRELPPGHALFGVPLETFAAREGTDYTLFRYRGNPRRYVLVHLTGLGRTEIDRQRPAILFDGTFAEFLEFENARISPTKNLFG